ncbi:hypothetical protein [Nitratifractor sp.]
MRKSTQSLLEKLSEEASNRLTHYRYNRSERLHPRYRKGQISALEWLCDLSEYYLIQEKRLKEELRKQVWKQMEAIALLDPGPYRQGIEDAVREMMPLLED